MNDRSLLPPDAPMIFAGAPIDRAEIQRKDPAALEALENDPRAMGICLHRAQPHLGPDGALTRIAFRFRPQGHEPVLLGLQDGAPLYAFDCVEPALDMPGQYADARMAAMGLSPDEAALLGQARSLIEWRRKHRFCANCGSETAQAAGGAKRVCGGCGAEHFPRVDPVAIMLATDGDRCLLGRQAAWPPRIWSALAGFTEPGETLEEACARELKEEAGVTADIAAIRYVMGQPWPFPSQLMMGLVAPVIDARIQVDETELEQARWFSRDEVADMLAGRHPEAEMPPSVAIARRLAELWVAGKI
jgi:NAD+ diphosphatase